MKCHLILIKMQKQKQKQSWLLKIIPMYIAGDNLNHLNGFGKKYGNTLQPQNFPYIFFY